ncbi:glycosyltransferase [Candidatus Omnitrophota bacterium]
MERYPKFTVSIPVYNSSRYLAGCLKSIRGQDYPKDKIEVVVADGGSTDNTVEIARDSGARVYNNLKRLGDYGAKVVAEHATGELLVVFAADNELVGKDWLRRVAEVFAAYPRVAALWGRIVSGRNDARINKYYALIQSDPMSHFINKNLDYYFKRNPVSRSPSVGDHFLFDVMPDRQLCWGANGLVYRLDLVKDIILRSEYVGDNEVFQYMTESGNNRVAYLPDLKTAHHHIDSIRGWAGKWKRNLTTLFFAHAQERRVDWAFRQRFKLKLVFWLIYSLFFPISLLHSVFLALRERTAYWLYHPLMCFIQTFVYVVYTLKQRNGLKILFNYGSPR